MQLSTRLSSNPLLLKNCCTCTTVSVVKAVAIYCLIITVMSLLVSLFPVYHSIEMHETRACKWCEVVTTI